MKTVLIVGPGPSVKDLDLAPLRKFETIAVTQAWKIAPWARFSVFIDDKWAQREFRHTPRENMPELVQMPMRWTPGNNAGAKALHLADVLWRPDTIILAGLDMGLGKNGETNAHGDYESATNQFDAWRDSCNDVIERQRLYRDTFFVSVTPTKLDVCELDVDTVRHYAA